MKDYPLVSIIIPVYNGSNFMREAIDSALNQTYKNIEIIVVNDGSTDETEEIALSYGNKIRYFKKENGGVSTALNLGIKVMRGEYFSWLSHDDKYAPEKIEYQVQELFDLHTEEAICLCDSSLIDKNSQPMKDVISKKTFKKVELSWQESLIDVLNRGSYNGCALLLPKSIFERVGLFDENMRYCQDLFMWIKIFLAGYNLIYLPKVLVYGRVHDKQLTQTGKAFFHSDCILMNEKLLSELSEKSSKKSNFLYYFAVYNAKYNNCEVVNKIFSKDNNVLSSSQKIYIRLIQFYGVLRPTIRKIYYRIFRRVKTN